MHQSFKRWYIEILDITVAEIKYSTTTEMRDASGNEMLARTYCQAFLILQQGHDEDNLYKVLSSLAETAGGQSRLLRLS